MSTIHGFPHAARVHSVDGRRRIDWLALQAGCYGNCAQGRRACTMPGVCGRRVSDAHTLSSMQRGAMPSGDWADTEPAAPAPAEACTELGVDDGVDHALRRKFWLAYMAAFVVFTLWVLW